MNRELWIEGAKITYHPEWIKKWRADPFSVLPVYVEVSPAGKCNHRCTFCAPEFLGYPDRFIDANVLALRLDEMKRLREEDPDQTGFKAIQYAGEGEPTLHKDLAKICRLTRKAGIDVGVLTNGTGLHEKLAYDLIPWVNGYLQASINAGRPETYYRIHRCELGHWDIVWRNMERAVKIKHELGIRDCDIGANMTVLIDEPEDVVSTLPIFGQKKVPSNWREMEDLARQAKDIGLDYVSFKPYSQHPKSENTGKLYGKMSYTQLMDELFEMAKDIKRRYASETFEVIFRFTRFQEYEQKTRVYDRCVATPTLWSYIQSDGTWISCSAHWGDERFHLGDINTDSIRDIWFSERRRQHLEFVSNELDVSCCRIGCHPDKDNTYLYRVRDLLPQDFEVELTHLRAVNPKPKRANFI